MPFNLHAIDLLLLLLLAATAVSGWRRGFAVVTLGYAGLLVGLALGAWAAARVGLFISAEGSLRRPPSRSSAACWPARPSPTSSPTCGRRRPPGHRRPRWRPRASSTPPPPPSRSRARGAADCCSAAASR